MKKLFLAGVIFLSACSVKQYNRKATLEYPTFDMEAHRGGRGVIPENTIESMLYAVDLGVNTLEMDAHVTADGQVILSHDDYINPLITLKPDGTEIAAAERENYAFMQMDYADIRKFDVGSKFFSLYPKQKKMKVHIPLLTDVIDAVQKRLKESGKRQVFYNIEVKSAKAGDNNLNPTPEVFVKKLMDIVHKKKIAPYVIVQSADVRPLQLLNREYPNIKTSFLVGSNRKKLTLEENLKELDFKPFIYSPNFKYLTKEIVMACHKKGIKVVAWTPNTQAEIELLKSWGVDGIITDYPELFFEQSPKIGFNLKPYTNSVLIECDNIRGAAKYEVRYTTSPSDFNNSENIISAFTRLEVKNLKPSSTYFFQERVLNKSRWSDWSDVKRCKTAAFSTTIGTYNILSCIYDPVFPENIWFSRRKAMVDIIRQSNNCPDILGIQEGMNLDQVQYLIKSLQKTYDVHVSEKKISPRAIFWKKNKYELVSFDDNIEVMDSTVSGHGTSRFASHVRLKEKNTQKDILVFNVHAPSSYSENKENERNLLAEVLSKKIKTLSVSDDVSAIVVGDFNSLIKPNKSDGTTAPMIMLKNGFLDTFDAASEHMNAFYNTHDRITLGTSSAGENIFNSGKRIDYIFSYPADRFTVSDYRIVINFVEDSGTVLRKPIPSDHRPVRSTLHIF